MRLAVGRAVIRASSATAAAGNQQRSRRSTTDEEANSSARYGQRRRPDLTEDLAAYLDARRRNWPSNTVVERKMREWRASSGASCLATPAEPRPRPRP